MPKPTTIALWALTILLAAAFAMAGFAKLSAAPQMVENFARWGFPAWFLTLTGAIELGAAILLLIPRASFYGAALLVPTMIGAAATHLLKGDPVATAVPALVLLALSAAIAYARRPAFLRPAPRAGLRAGA
jgi:putative oxidoreductase